VGLDEGAAQQDPPHQPGAVEAVGGQDGQLPVPQETGGVNVQQLQEGPLTRVETSPTTVYSSEDVNKKLLFSAQIYYF
jgi:hypothetical protein